MKPRHQLGTASLTWPRYANRHSWSRAPVLGRLQMALISRRLPDMPNADRRHPARNRDDRLRHVLEQMFANGERISARGALKHMPDVRAPSSLTRDPVRRQILEEYRRRQTERNAWAERAKKQSAARLEKALADRDRRIAELEHQLQVLVASHRGLVEAVGELGGLPKWRQAFQGYEPVLEEIVALGAGPGPRDMAVRARRCNRRSPRTG